MSKSLGNFFTARDLVEGHGADPLALRYALISQNYGTPHNFTMDLLRDAASKIDRYRQCFKQATDAMAAKTPGDDTIGADLDRLYDDTLAAMCDNLNMSVALANALEGTKVILRQAGTMSAASGASAANFIQRINALIGIVFADEQVATPTSNKGPSPEWIEERIEARTAAKAAKDYAGADAIRKELEAEGVELRDTPGGVEWRIAMKA
jgi:cysteinyl-tRNA synthetase